MPWLGQQQAPKSPYFIDAFERANGLQVYWSDDDTLQRTQQYVLYRFESTEVVNLNDPTKILALVPQMPDPQFTDVTYQKGHTYTYVVTALDRMQNESFSSEPLRTKVQNGKTIFIFP
jgi:hypothetical protein